MNIEQRVEVEFKNHFGASFVSLVRSPGRVNLIGEHADYNKIPNDLWL
jgi:galactokinase